MTSHTSLQMPSLSPKAPVPQRPSANNVEAAIQHFNSLLELPSVTRATFLPSSATDEAKNTLLLDASHRSISALTKRSATQTLGLGADGQVTFTSPIAFTSPEVKHTSYSPNGKLQAVFRSISAKESKGGKNVIEIWSVQDGAKLEELDVTEEHGDWYFDATFGPPSWHPSSQALLYTAEAPEPKTEGSSLPQQSSYKYTPDFGETFTGKKFPSIFLFLLPSSPFVGAVSSTEESSTKPSVHRLTSEEHFPTTSFGQSVFLPDHIDGTPRILATGYSSIGGTRKLGIVYCANRPAQIYEFAISIVPSSTSSKLSYRVLSATSQSDPNRSARSPRVLHPQPNSRFSPLVVFLSNPVGGPHSSCASLHAVALQKDGGAKAVELVPSVDKPSKLEDFPGLYVDQLPQQPFVLGAEGPAVVLSSIWRSRRVPLLVSLRTGELKSLAEWPEPKEDDVVLPYLGREDELASVNVLGTDGGKRIVATRSGVTTLPELVLWDLEKAGEWKVLKKALVSKKISDALAKLSYTVLPLPKFGASELILVSPVAIDPAAPAQPNLPPLITFPHGGPHSTTTTDWSAYTACLAIAGYRVALVNYPGSLGFGQTFVDELPPQLGTLEVEATLAAGHYLNTLSLASRTKGKKFILGGSHGGWIAAHLSARFPDEYDAAVMRNPVIDLASNSFNTDIPDWCYAEGAIPYSLSRPPIAISPSTYAHLHSISPLTHSQHVTLPTLLLLGASDRRVPPDQGRSWYHALKGNQKGEVEMFVFEGNGHALDGTVEAEVVGYEAGLRWLERWTEW